MSKDKIPPAINPSNKAKLFDKQTDKGEGYFTTESSVNISKVVKLYNEGCFKNSKAKTLNARKLNTLTENTLINPHSTARGRIHFQMRF